MLDLATVNTAARNYYDRDEKILVLRQSAISAFQACRRNFYWEYVIGIEPDYQAAIRPWATSTTGTAVHLGVEYYYGKLGDPLQAIKEWADENYPGWEADDKASKGVRLATTMMAGHIADVEADGVDIGETTLDVEHSVLATVDVNGWAVTVTGQIDRIVEDRDGRLVIEDTKTTDKIDSTLKYIQQLGRYAVLLRIETGQVADAVRSNQIKRVLRNGAGPFYSRPWVPFNDDAYTSHYDNLHATLADIVQAYDQERWYERVSMDCSWRCRVQDVCIAQQHGDNHETIVELYFRNKEGASHG